MLRPVLKDFFTGLTDLLYPPNCLLCATHIPSDSPSKEVCPRCLKKLRPNIPPFCPKCSRHMGDEPFGAYCKSCSKNEIAFDFAWSACLINEELRALLHLFKYNGKTQLRHEFARRMAGFIHEYRLDVEQFDCLMPVPLFHAHQRERGYNQAQLLTTALSPLVKVPAAADLKKNRPTRSQTQLSSKERWTNVEGAFTMKTLQKINGKNILLVDDILTTGATTSEAARALKDAGAATVGVVTVGTVL